MFATANDLKVPGTLSSFIIGIHLHNTLFHVRRTYQYDYYFE